MEDKNRYLVLKVVTIHKTQTTATTIGQLRGFNISKFGYCNTCLYHY